MGDADSLSTVMSTLPNPETRGQIIVEEYGPFYAQGTPRELTSSEYQNRKVLVTGQYGIPTGVYFADVWITSGTITLPANTYSARMVIPDPCGFEDIGTMEEGVDWNVVTKSSGVELEWKFYTMVLNYNAVGQQIWHVIPIDGADVVIPYYYGVQVN